MQPTAICFSVMVRPNDSQTGHSVTQLAARGGGCCGQEARSRKHVKKRCHIMKTSQKHLAASEISLVRKLKHLVTREEGNAMCQIMKLSYQG